jgi:hypothetical protein
MMPPWSVIVLMAIAVVALAVYVALTTLYPIAPAR